MTLSEEQIAKKWAQENDQSPWNLVLNILINIAIPSQILSKMSSEDRLGPLLSLVVALCIPLLYFLFDWVKKGKTNLIAALGFVNTLLTGGLGVLNALQIVRVEIIWFAVKEAIFPGLIGIAVIASLKTKKPLVHAFLYNEKIIHVEKVKAALLEKGTTARFEALLIQSTFIVAASFFLSSFLNFMLAIIVLKSSPGSAEFNQELSYMLWLSWPVIVVPSMIVLVGALWRLITGIKALTGLDFESVMKGAQKESST